MKLRYKLLLVFAITVVLGWNAERVLALVWDSAGYESSPTAGEAVSLGDDRIREHKEQIRFRQEAEHEIGVNTNDNGLHTQGSARCFTGNAAPTVLHDTRRDYDNSSAVSCVTGAACGTGTLTAAVTNSGGSGGADVVGAGRCFIDQDGPDNIPANTDDNTLFVWDDSATAFVIPPPGLTNADLVRAGAYNLIYNGSFEVTDGTGLVAAIAVPDGWVATGGPTMGYTSPPTNAAEGTGVQVDITDSGGAGGDEISQVLTNLKGANILYRVVVRAAAGAASNCRINTTGATVNLANQDTAVVTGTTLGGFFGTSAALDTVTLHLISVGAGDLCHWDHVAVYEQTSDGISQPGVQAVYDTDNTAADVPAAFTAVPNLSVAFTPPTPGWIVEVHADLAFSLVGDSRANAHCRLDRNGTDLAGTTHGVYIDDEHDATEVATLGLSFIEINPAPGTTLTYTAECVESGVGTMRYNDSPVGIALDSNLWLIAHPTR